MTDQKSDPLANPAAEGTTGAKSPANEVKPNRTRKRIPMHNVNRKLEVPELAGYRLYWFVESNIPAALRAYYEFVTPDEVNVNQHNPGNDENVSGNLDVGNRVKLYAGKDEQGKPEYFYLMKLEKQYADEDAREIAKKNAQMLEGVFKREQILGDDQQEAGADMEQRYVRPDMTRAKIPLFMRPVRKR